jgi:hypothetical protein
MMQLFNVCIKTKGITIRYDIDIVCLFNYVITGFKSYCDKKRTHNAENIAGQDSVVRQLRPEASGLASLFRVLRTGKLAEIRPDNMYQPLGAL